MKATVHYRIPVGPALISGFIFGAGGGAISGFITGSLGNAAAFAVSLAAAMAGVILGAVIGLLTGVLTAIAGAVYVRTGRGAQRVLVLIAGGIAAAVTVSVLVALLVRPGTQVSALWIVAHGVIAFGLAAGIAKLVVARR